jgi:hypothetical protein
MLGYSAQAEGLVIAVGRIRSIVSRGERTEDCAAGVIPGCQYSVAVGSI